MWKLFVKKKKIKKKNRTFNLEEQLESLRFDNNMAVRSVVYLHVNVLIAE